MKLRLYTYAEANRDLSGILTIAQESGAVAIRGPDGRAYVLQPEPKLNSSPLDIPGIDLDITTEEIVQTIREMRGDPLN